MVFPVEGIGYDLEGTVVDVEEARHRAHLEIASELSLSLSLEEVIERGQHFIGGSDEDVMKDLWALTGQSAEAPMAKLVAHGVWHYEQFLQKIEIKPRPGFLEFFYRAQVEGMRQSIGSLTPAKQAEVLLNRSGLLGLFGNGSIVLREHVANYKPAPDVFLETARRMGIDPANQLVFEDSPRGIQAAIAAGSRAIGMPVYPLQQTGFRLIEAGACRIFCNWQEIEAGWLINNLNNGR